MGEEFQAPELDDDRDGWLVSRTRIDAPRLEPRRNHDFQVVSPPLTRLAAVNLFLTVQIMAQIVLYTNEALGPDKKQTDAIELFALIGVMIFMSFDTLKVRRDYWSDCWGHPAVYRRFTRARYEELIHAFSVVPARAVFNVPIDKLHHLRSFIAELNTTFAMYAPRGAPWALDETMVAFKSFSSMHLQPDDATHTGIQDLQHWMARLHGLPQGVRGQGSPAQPAWRHSRHGDAPREIAIVLPVDAFSRQRLHVTGLGECSDY